MTNRECSIEGCERPVLARGWCQSHYGRWRLRGGDPAVDLRDYAHLRHKSPEHIAKIAAAKRHPRKPCVICGAPRARTDPYHVTCGSPGCSTEARKRAAKGRPRRTGQRRADVGYAAVHWRLAQERSPDDVCIICGVGGVPLQWALVHGQGTKHDERYGPYSLDPADYVPACIPCHVVYDHLEAA